MNKNFKNDKDSLENKLEKIQRTSKTSDSKIQVEGKEANTNLILAIVQKEANLVKNTNNKNTLSTPKL